MRASRTAAPVIAMLAVACLARAAAAPSAPPPAAAVSHAPVLVTIVVDQLAAWMADERWPALPADGGFARLRREGLTVREMHFAHAATETAPGHSALYTGAVPRESGIVANDVVPPGGGEPVALLAAPGTFLVTPTGPGPGPGSSLDALRVDTLADALVAAAPDATVISLSLKDRGALFGAGHHPSAVVWLDVEEGTFVTSSAFAQAFPAWATPLGDAAALKAAMAAPWQLGDPAWVAAHAATADNAPGEGSYQGLGRTFPHPATNVKALRATPAGDALLFALADAAVGEIAKRNGPGLLAVSLSSHDYILHVFGPHSWEAWDELAKLDRALALFLDRLDRALGPDGYAVMLTGDHGGNALPELSTAPPSPWCAHGGRPDHWQRTCGPRRRLVASEIADALEDALDKKFAHRVFVPFIAGMADPFISFGAEIRGLPPADQALLLRTAKDVLRRRFGFAEVFDVRAMPARCPPLTDESLRALVCRSVRPDGPGDLYLVVKPGSFVDPKLAVGAGTSHGSPYLYDRAVPLLVRAPGRVPAGVVRTKPVMFDAFARTAAALLGVRPPAAAAAGEDLTRPQR
jgi:hypothetical protein